MSEHKTLTSKEVSEIWDRTWRISKSGMSIKLGERIVAKAPCTPEEFGRAGGAWQKWYEEAESICDAMNALNRRAPSAEQLCEHEWTSTSLDKPYTIFCGKCFMREERAEQQQQEPVANLRAGFEQFCSQHCSPGADSSEWYWKIWQAAVQFVTHQQPQVQPQLVIGQEVVDQRDEYVGYLQMIADKIGLDAEPHQTYFDRLMERIDSLKQPQTQGGPVAVVGDTYSLFWIGTGPIAPLIARHNIKPGDKLYTQPSAAVPDDAAIQRALNAIVAEGESVYWHIVFGLSNDSVEVRSIMAHEIIRTALLAAAAPAQPGDAQGGEG